VDDGLPIRGGGAAEFEQLRQRADLAMGGGHGP
jgi:hypothetical protein